MSYSSRKSNHFSPLIPEYSFINKEKVIGETLFKKMDESTSSVASGEKTSKSIYNSNRKSILWNILRSQSRNSSISIMEDSPFSPETKENKLSLRQLDKFNHDQLLNVYMYLNFIFSVILGLVRNLIIILLFFFFSFSFFLPLF
jgi:hypothetical protein